MDSEAVQLDDQQEQLVARLRAADGAPVSFEELRDIGIENPALLCYELAAVGLPITRTAAPAEGMPAMSARLDPAPAASPWVASALSPGPDGAAAEPSVPPPPPPRAPRAARPRAARARRGPGGARLVQALRRPAGAGELARRTRAWAVRLAPAKPAALAIVGLFAAFAAVLAVALGELAHRPTVYVWASRPAPAHTRAAAARRPVTTPASSSPAGVHVSPPPPPGAPTTAGPTPPAAAPAPQAASPASAADLEARGHQLLADRSYSSAIPPLAAAVRVSGQSLAVCSEPSSEPCLTFAYALYDLGRALRLDGRRAEAVSVLSERLRIDNQRATVLHELELARGAPA